jgi:hypothetical protein
MDREMEDRHLLLADRHIAVGKFQIAAQETLVAKLRAQGRDTDVAEKLLALFRDTLASWETHRSLIAASLVERP